MIILEILQLNNNLFIKKLQLLPKVYVKDEIIR